MFTKKSISRNFSVLFVVVFMLTMVGPVYAAPASLAEPTKVGTPSLLQFSAGGHVLGFALDKVYLAGLDHALTVEFVGGQGHTPVGAAASTTTQEDGAPVLGRVTYPGVWRGVDVIYTASQAGIAESSYIVQPGAHPADIRLKYNTPVQLMEAGTLRFAFETGYMTESAPIAFQDVNGQRVAVAVRFTLNEDLVDFAVGAYDPDYALTIDQNYVWHTFYGSAEDADDAGKAITHDASGNIYVAGYSEGTWNGPYGAAPLNAYAAGYDIVVVKLNSAGAYQWHTFYGSSTRNDVGHAITSDGSGNIYVAGDSAGTWNGPGNCSTPGISPCPLNAHAGGTDYETDIVVIKLNSAGAYQWHTFYGQLSKFDFGNAITHDANGNIYVAGESAATWNGPGVTAPLNAYAGGSSDIVVVNLNSAGAYQWHTFYGSTNTDDGSAITSDGSGIYVAGDSKAAWDGPGAVAPLNAHGSGIEYDILVVKLNSAGAYQWHTFYGHSLYTDYGNAITSDGIGNIYVAGQSAVGWNGPGATAPLNAHAGLVINRDDIVVIKLNSAGAYQWHTFYGSFGYDGGSAITSDASGIYVAGWSGTTWDGPGAVAPLNAHDPVAGGRDIVVFKLNNAGAYQWHTFHGSSAADYGDAITSDGNGNLYVAGESEATWNGPGSTPPLNPHGGYTGPIQTPIDIVVIKLAVDVGNPLLLRIYLPLILR